jgi:hypothetical protein
MKYKYLLLLTILFVVALSATAQSASIVGTWALIAADKILPDGNRVSDHYGTSRTASLSSPPTATMLFRSFAPTTQSLPQKTGRKKLLMSPRKPWRE